MKEVLSAHNGTNMVYYQETNILVASHHLIYGSAMVVSGRIIHLLSHKPPGILDLRQC